jgi:hypothetical protein
MIRGDSRQTNLPLTMGIVRPRYEYTKTRQLIFWRLDLAQAINKLDEPWHTRVEIRGIVRAERRPWYHVPGNCCPKTEDLCCRCRRCCGVYKILSTDTRRNNKNKKRRDPNTILVPAERQENVERESFLRLMWVKMLTS